MKYDATVQSVKEQVQMKYDATVQSVEEQVHMYEIGCNSTVCRGTSTDEI